MPYDVEQYVVVENFYQNFNCINLSSPFDLLKYTYSISSLIGNDLIHNKLKQHICSRMSSLMYNQGIAILNLISIAQQIADKIRIAVNLNMNLNILCCYSF